ncbi:MAG: helix-turn-helix transcriptional regulator [Massilioclostridium sp.]|nr:helix-turn-helix transcriptional regulator [Massilioclostridium sp.]
MIISQRLKDLRSDADLNQQDVADAVNVTQSSISNYELGVNLPDLDVVIKLAKFFNVSSDYLLGITDVKTSWSDMKDHIILPSGKVPITKFLRDVKSLDTNDRESLIRVLNLALNQVKYAKKKTNK